MPNIKARLSVAFDRPIGGCGEIGIRPVLFSRAKPFQELAVPVRMSVADHVNNHEPRLPAGDRPRTGDKGILNLRAGPCSRAKQLDRSGEGQVPLAD